MMTSAGAPAPKHRRGSAISFSGFGPPPGLDNIKQAQDLYLHPKPAKMPEGKKKLPKPGPAKLSKNAGVDEWLKCAFNNQYLPESVMKKLCEICKEFLMEGKSSKYFGMRFPRALLIVTRVEHPTSLNTCYRLWRPSRPVLRCPRIVPRSRRCSQRRTR